MDKGEHDNLIAYFANRKYLSTNDIYSYFAQNKPEIARTTVNWYIYKLVRQGVFQRIGRGRFMVGNRSVFQWLIQESQKQVAESKCSSRRARSCMSWSTSFR